MDLGDRPRDLAGHEVLTTARALVIEEDAVAGMHAVRLAVVDNDPVGIQLGNTCNRG